MKYTTSMSIEQTVTLFSKAFYSHQERIQLSDEIMQTVVDEFRQACTERSLTAESFPRPYFENMAKTIADFLFEDPWVQKLSHVNQFFLLRVYLLQIIHPTLIQLFDEDAEEFAKQN